MKVVGFCGSPRKSGNTSIMVKSVLEGVKSHGIDTELLYLSDFKFSGCIGCEGCKNSFLCILRDDMQQLYEKLNEAEAIVLGSPTYFYNMTSITKRFIERLYCLDVFDKSDRSVWLSKNEIDGIKYAVTVAVCEQQDIESMGYTSIAMDKSLQAVGYRVVESLKALKAFKAGEIEAQNETLEKARLTGIKLGSTLLLSNEYKLKLSKHSIVE